MSDDPFNVDENKLRDSMNAWRSQSQDQQAVAANQELEYARTQLEQTTSFIDYLVGAASAQTPIAVTTTYGAAQRGVIALANEDVVHIAANYADVWLPTWAIASIQPIEGVREIPLVDLKQFGPPSTMGSVLQDLGQQGVRLQIKLEQGTIPLTGHVAAIGEDTVTIQPDDSAPSRSQVRIATIVEVLRFKKV